MAALTVAQLPGEVVAAPGAVAQQLPGVGAVPLPAMPPQQGIEPEHQVEAGAVGEAMEDVQRVPCGEEAQAATTLSPQDGDLHPPRL